MLGALLDKGSPVSPLGILALHEIVVNAALHGHPGLSSGRSIG
nr:hypothetical protein [uncultured Lichenicoccus sp.]